MTLEQILKKLERVQPSGDQYSAKCPAHDDGRNSLSITEGDDGRVLVRCHAGCAFKDVAAAMGLSGGDFGPARTGKRAARVVANYDYLDETGKLLSQVQRKEDKSFVQRQPQPDGGWKYSTHGVRKVPYRLPALLAEPDRDVIIVEGEKDADALSQLGLLATTSPGGACSWNMKDNKFFTARTVVIIPDNDEAGMRHADEVGASLKDVALSVQVLELPGLPHKGDVSDWLEAGGTAEDLELLAENAPDWEEWHEERDPVGEPEDTWSPPANLGKPDLPDFPIDALPEVLGDFARGVATEVQVPVDLPGVLVLAAMSVASGGRMVVQVREGLVEPVNLYIVSVLDPGNRKSPVLRKVTAPIEAYESELTEQMRETVIQDQVAYDTMARTLDSAQKRAAKADADDREPVMAEVRDLATQFAEMQRPSMPRLIADDATPEKISSLMAEQGGRLAVISSEGGILDILAGRYSSGQPNLDLFLKAWDGETVRIDRMARAAERVERPALTLALTVQQDVLRTLASRRVFRGRGLLARLLYSLPRSPLGTRSVDPPTVPKAVTNAYATTLKMIFGNGASLAESKTIELSPEARATWQGFLEDLEPRLGPAGDLSTMTDWAGKIVGTSARIAGLLHVAANPVSPWEKTISHETMKNAVIIAEYFTAHAKAAFDLMGADPQVDAARHVLAWMMRQGVETFTARDCFEGTKGRFKKMDSLRPALRILEDHGYIWCKPQPAVRRPGRPPSPTYDVNPRVHDRETPSHKSQKPQAEESSANTANTSRHQETKEQPRVDIENDDFEEVVL